MTHSTLTPDIKGFVDEIKKTEDGLLYCKGWCFYHKTMDARPLRLMIGDKDENSIETQVRTDVGNHYKNNAVDDCGWEFAINPKHGVHRIDMDVYGEWQPVFVLKEEEESPRSEETKTKPTRHSKGHTSPQTVKFAPKITKDVRAIPSLIIADNFYENPDEVRQFALQCDFKAHPENHKGQRTDECYRFKGLKERFEDLIGLKIKNWDKYGTNGCFQLCIGGDQIVYHRDEQQYGGVLFLSPNAPVPGGTALYRSVHTKKMKVKGSEADKVFKNGFLDSSQFEMVDRVGNVYNRLALFDAQIIHSGLDYFGNSKDNGRLFQLFFFDLDFD